MFMRLLFSLLFTFTAFIANAQHMQMKSFKLIENDTEALLEQKKTPDGEPCVLIKVVTRYKNFQFDFYAAPVCLVENSKKISEVWVWVRDDARRFEIQHKDLGVYRGRLPERLQPYKVYEMVLTTEKFETIKTKELNSIKKEKDSLHKLTSEQKERYNKYVETFNEKIIKSDKFKKERNEAKKEIKKLKKQQKKQEAEREELIKQITIFNQKNKGLEQKEKLLYEQSINALKTASKLNNEKYLNAINKVNELEKNLLNKELEKIKNEKNNEIALQKIKEREKAFAATIQKMTDEARIAKLNNELQNKYLYMLKKDIYQKDEELKNLLAEYKKDIKKYYENRWSFLHWVGLFTVLLVLFYVLWFILERDCPNPTNKLLCIEENIMKDYAYANRKDIKKVRINKNVKIIYFNPFKGCVNLKEIQVHQSKKYDINFTDNLKRMTNAKIVYYD